MCCGEEIVWWSWLTTVSKPTACRHNARDVHRTILSPRCSLQCVGEAALVTHAGKSAREQRGYFTNSEYIGDYPCRWEHRKRGRSS